MASTSRYFQTKHSHPDIIAPNTVIFFSTLYLKIHNITSYLSLILFFLFLFLAALQHMEFPGQESLLGSGIEPASWQCRDATNPIVPQQELLILLFFFFF